MDNIMKNDKKKYSFLIFILFFCIIFNSLLTNYVSSYFSFIDDIFNIFIVLLNLLIFINVSFFSEKATDNFLQKSYLIFILFICFGLLGNFLSGYQQQVIAILLDILSWFKFFGTFFVVYYFSTSKRIVTLSNTLELCAKATLIIAVFFEILTLLGFIEQGVEFARYGINVLTFGDHPSSTSSKIALCVCILFIKNEKKNKFLCLLGLILCILTFRAKAIGFSIFGFYFLFFYNKKYVRLQILLVLLISFSLVFQQIYFYFFRSTASRAVLLLTSFSILRDNFPFGGGFASFGTTYSGMYYSNVYYLYGLSNRWGFSPEAYSFIGDGGLATIFGQFGFIGTILFFYLLFLSFQQMIKFSSQAQRKGVILLIVYLLIASTNEVVFTNSTAFLYAFASLIAFQYKEKKETNKKFTFNKRITSL